MGQIEIIEKLNNEFKREINRECQVVYILSRVRKILEIKNQKNKYKLLNFYCNWVLHSKLDGYSTKILINNLFEHDIDCKKSAKWNAIKMKSCSKHFFDLLSLKQEIDDFFNENCSSINLSEKNWASFGKLLLGIINECPIILNSSKLRQIELFKDKNGIYGYKFYLVGLRNKPIIKLKLK